VVTPCASHDLVDFPNAYIFLAKADPRAFFLRRLPSLDRDVLQGSRHIQTVFSGR
jgi:hypothetical protein